ncbi:universal stress protein [Leptolyngbya sp. BL0902]|uniref:universal stress protein n=1 Tax=Leptolyngbya sp. BL0902 TaxID=1115757 RepID=UPI0018E78E1A|nr:universal stress protein [Leptolyngbya sp. BL0902]QQE65932.1 universal stress protein [Leptolyngbya sp. BL0902]
MFDVVLIALDCTPFDQEVMVAAQQLRLEEDVTVVFVHVLPYAEDTAGQDVSRPLPPTHDFPHGQLEQYLRSCADQLADPALGQNFRLDTLFEIVQGDAETEIIRLANIHQADLILLGSRGLTGVNRILAGSVSSQVVADAPCTVMVVKPPQD